MTSETKGAKARYSKNLELSRVRVIAMLLVTALLFGAIAVRLGQLQIVGREKLETIGASQRIKPLQLAADRGSIFDREGRDLAISVPQKTIWADPSLITEPYQAAALLAPILNKDVADLGGKLSQTGRFVYIARTVDDDVAARVKALNIKGIAMYDEPKRFLPGDSLLGSVVGQVGVDNEGLSGLELQYDKQLSGTPGSLVVEQDPAGNDIPGGLRKGEPAQRGDDLMLTIDSELQNKVEQALSKEITLANARGGMAAVMDTKTGEVLALSNLKVANDGFGTPVVAPSNNMALTDTYEPGSVSKLITISAALESGIVNPSSAFSISDQMKVADATFHDADPHPTENWTTTDILAASSNIGTITIAQKLGKDRLDHYQRAFGYGSTTGLKFPGEAAGRVLDPKKYSGTSLATTAIGQGVSVTAVQMLAAFNTIANGGVYVAPKLVKATIDSNGKEHPTAPSATHQVVSTQTAKQMNLMLQEVVRVGTATAAKIDGYDVAGKTGTARKPLTTGRGYQEGAYISSFAGFVPAGAPQLTAIVVLDQPTPIYGGLVAAPVFADVTRYALQENNIAPVAQSADRSGVPLANPSATSAADESGVAGTTAADANAATANANKGATTTTSTTAPTGTTQKNSSTSIPAGKTTPALTGVQ